MADTEEYFPRGGKKPAVTHFKQSANFLGAPEKSEKKKRAQKKKSEDAGYISDDGDKVFDQSRANCAKGISFATAKPGLLILGRVKEIQETKVLVMLPCRMTGQVMACHISDPYSKQLEAYVNDQVDKVVELSEMFHLGQYVALKILEVSEKNLILSMMPSHVNSGKQHTDLHIGCLLQAAVSSIEDHGYVMDIGIPNTRAFLPKKNTNSEILLELGMLTWCAVKTISPSPESSIVTLSNQLAVVQNAIQRKHSTTPLLPGTAVDFVVYQPLDNGIEGHIFKDTTAYVQRFHADLIKGKKPTLGQKVRARILYVMPTRNTPFLTMRNIFESTYPDLETEQRLNVGDIVEEALVMKIQRRSIHFKLAEGCLGVMSLKRITVEEDLADEEVVAKSYPLGSTHRVRITSYNLCDYMYSVTDDPSVINQKYLSISQLSVGDIVTATVKHVDSAAGHVIVNIGRVQGIVPNYHLSDTGVFVDPKKASVSKIIKKFKEGQEVQARVLWIAAPKVTLTLKPSLLSPELEVLQSYEDAQIGKAYTGTIKVVRDYIIVTFFNNVAAFVPRQYVSKVPIEDLSDAFHIGQIVTCTIIKVDAANNKMTGSFTTIPFSLAKTKKDNLKRKMDDPYETKNKKQKFYTESDNENENNTQEDGNIGVKKKKKNKNELKLIETKTIDEEKINTFDVITKDKEEQNEYNVENQLVETEETNVTEKKRKRRKDKQTESESDQHDEHECDNVKFNKKMKIIKENNVEVLNKTEKEDETQIKKKNKTNKKDKQKVTEMDHREQEKIEIAEESDTTDTGIQDDDTLLTPLEMGLTDLSDCTDVKKCKKRVVSLFKAIKSRTHRLDRIEKKIVNIEEQGLNTKNKKYHTAMQTEKYVIQERIKQILQVLTLAQEKLKEFEYIPNKDFKTKKINKNSEEASEIKENDQKINLENTNEPEKEIKIKKNEIKLVENLKPVLEIPSAKDFWSANAQKLSQAAQEDVSSDSDQEKEQPKKKRKKMTIAEKEAKIREEEQREQDMEMKAIESEALPHSNEQFERVLLDNPNSSQLWISYMAFHLQATEIERARAVGQRAVTTIYFREEQERLNVWLALLDLENRFGTKETEQKILEEALQRNEPFQVHSKLLDIYLEFGKKQEVSSLVDLMLRKYKREPSTYTLCGSALYKLRLVKKARHVMQKAMVVLDKKEHIPILVQFALMERSIGEDERAETVFEKVLSTYPQRVDVCCAYVDMLSKYPSIERIREVLERMTAQGLPARKMKVLYKKWTEMEEILGDAEHVEAIRQRAIDYIKKAKF